MADTYSPDEQLPAPEAGVHASQPSARKYGVSVSVWTPGRVNWHLRIWPDGNGYVGYIALPESWFPEGTFSTPEVVGQLMPTLRTEDSNGSADSVDGIREHVLDYGASAGNPYSIWIDDTGYLPSDYEAVAALFDAVRPHMTRGDLEKLEMHPPPGLPLPEAKWEDVAAELSRSSISGLPSRSKVMPPDAEQVKRVLLDGRTISRDEYRRRRSTSHPLSGEAQTPGGEKYEWLLTRDGLALVRTPESEVILLEVSLPASRPATTPSWGP